MFKRIILGVYTLLLCLTLKAQDYTWWNETHNWDGHTPWTNYITTNTAHMGPNALPVPEVNQGTTRKKTELKVGTDLHFSPGDKTQNPNTSLYLPLYTPKVGLQLQIVPIEFYQTDTITRDFRAARNRSGKGYAVGDFYISTFVQVVENHKTLPDIMLSINLKTASGNKFSDARFTDAPAYYMDLSFGKNYTLNASKNITLRPYLMGGFYVWQMRGFTQPQNDALLYGLGAKLATDHFTLFSSLAGYHGYLKNGDSPLVFRANFRTNFKGRINYSLRYQKGIKDFPFNTFSLNFITKF